MEKNRTTVQERDPFNMSRCPASIDFGQYDIQTWYSAPYPQEYARWGTIQATLFFKTDNNWLKIQWILLLMVMEVIICVFVGFGK